MIRRFFAPLVDGTRRLSRGFTMVELMVALSGGLFVSVAVFMLAKQATGLYQSEARASNATLGSVVGFERLRLDIERAAYLATPNVRHDPAVCGFPDGSWPQKLSHMSSIFIQPTPTTTLPSVLTDNKIAPDEIVLAGSYASVEQFWTESIDGSSGTNHAVVLQAASPAMARLGYQNMTTPAEQRSLLLSVFGIGRALRIVDTEAHEQYGTIVDVQGGALPTVFLSINSPPLQYRGSSPALKCGVMGNGKDHLVNVVNFVKYSLKNLSAYARYAPLYTTTVTTNTAAVSVDAPLTDQGRTELVREELDTSGAVILNSQEVVSEFAVDLRFGMSVAFVQNPGAPNTIEAFRTYPVGDQTDIAQWAGDPAALSPTNGPQRIRILRARLSVRSREADRVADIPQGGILPITDGLYRIGLGPSGGAPFARVRTVQADIAIRNHRGISWL